MHTIFMNNFPYFMNVLTTFCQIVSYFVDRNPHVHPQAHASCSAVKNLHGQCARLDIVRIPAYNFS